MDPWTLAYLAGHRDMNITKRYVHPQEQTIRAAMDRARSGKRWAYFWAYRHEAGVPKSVPILPSNYLIRCEVSGAPGGTRTPGLLVRSQSLYPAELRAR